jgi:predicted nucleotidyltransferase component of viral defense system
MPKLVFTQEQQLDLTRRLQLMLLDSMAASGNWVAPDATRFQGGTSLSLAYGSSRFSEDLDFVLGTDRGLNRMLAGATSRMANSLRTAVPGAEAKFAARDKDLEADEARNPRTFTMTVSHPDWYRAIKVKVEFWVADPEAVRQYEARVIPAKLLTQAVEGAPLRMTLPPVMMPTATLDEILVDKLHALACRPYLKHRDIFDLWWLSQQGHPDWHAQLVARYPNHARMYNDSPVLEQLGSVLRAKAAEVQALAGNAKFPAELRTWLGERSPLASQMAADAMATDVATRLNELVSTLEAKPEPPKPARRVRPR